MKIKQLSLIEETESHCIFEIVYKSFFREIKRKAIKKKTDNYPRWLDTNELIINYEGIHAWLSTDKKDFKV